MALLHLRGESIAEIKAVLFDKDGTLAYSQPNLEILAHTRIFYCQQSVAANQRKKLNKLLMSAYGIHQTQILPTSSISVASRHHNMISTATVFCQIGIPWAKAVRDASAIFQATDKCYQKINQFIDETTELAEQYLKALHSEGVICGVISNDNEIEIWRFLKYHRLENLVQIIWSSEDQPSKPNSEVIYHICDILQLQPVECMLISDADTDLYMAQKAGTGLTLGYTNGWTTNNVLYFGDYQVSNWSELEIRDQF
uniref:Haloacid dehalogenase/epoxide hydrolase family protein n=1 Tax=Paulinella longichromatophora TaxID=1708747 RepID=A0A2H4ZQ13_9EUKA|nr:hypothetical protein PLO_624 [Paulinella longichromatophora]